MWEKDWSDRGLFENAGWEKDSLLCLAKGDGRSEFAGEIRHLGASPGLQDSHMIDRGLTTIPFRISRNY